MNSEYIEKDTGIRLDVLQNQDSNHLTPCEVNNSTLNWSIVSKSKCIIG